jgi:Heterokaryon incompatibility protein (HET)
MAGKAVVDFGASIVSPIFRARPVTETSSTYLALNQKKKEFRILRVCPGKEEDPVACEMVIVPLSWRCPPFLALSYCWGDPKSPKAITVNGTSMNVTANLAEALSQLREFHNSSEKLPYRSTETYLWIDAICINQADIKEKNYQVPLMAEIYLSATRVLIWLGAGDRGSDIFMDWVRRSWKPPLVSFSNRQNLLLDKASPVDMYWLSLTILFRDWFSRIWTVQESVLPKKDPFVICGSKTESFAHLAEALRSMVTDSGWLGSRPPSQKIRPFLENVSKLESPSQLVKQFLTNHKRLDNVISMRDMPKTAGQPSWSCPTFERALVETKYHQATNMRDRIYGVLGLTPEPGKIGVNYELDLHQITTDAIFANCKNCSFMILAISQRHRMKLELDRAHPSWLPDFSKPTDYDYEFFRLSKFWQGSPRLKVTPDGKMITVPATSFDTVQTTKLLDFNPYESQEDLQDIERIATAAKNIILGDDNPLYKLREYPDDNVGAVMMFNSTIKLFGHLPRATRNARCQSLWKSLVQGNLSERP